MVEMRGGGLKVLMDPFILIGAIEEPWAADGGCDSNG
jgi:hypothetical protein